MSPVSTHVPLSPPPPPPLQPRLLQEPHRFLRDPLLRTLPARDGGLDHAVHNRIRPDVWLRLPAGVEEEEKWREGSGRGGASSYLHYPPAPCTVELISKRCCSWEHLLFVLDHLSVTDQKKTSARRSMLLPGGTPHQHPTLSPSHRPHLYVYYFYYSTTSDSITVPPAQ